LFCRDLSFFAAVSRGRKRPRAIRMQPLAYTASTNAMWVPKCGGSPTGRPTQTCRMTPGAQYCMGSGSEKCTTCLVGDGRLSAPARARFPPLRARLDHPHLEPLPFEQCGEILGDAMVAGADRPARPPRRDRLPPRRQLPPQGQGPRRHHTHNGPALTKRAARAAPPRPTGSAPQPGPPPLPRSVTFRPEPAGHSSAGLDTNPVCAGCDSDETRGSARGSTTPAITTR
jgi:hypothetical protein